MRKRKETNRHTGQRGFTLTELLIATVVVLVGLVAVAQLVPASVMINANNRNDGTALVFAQRQMEAMRAQPLGVTGFIDPQGVYCYPAGQTCQLGDPTQPGAVVGSPVAVSITSNLPLIDFTATAVTGYSFIYTDPNDPFGATYDVRWAVVTVVNGQNVVTGKRIILGVFRRGMQTPTLPITLDTMVEK